MKPQSIVNKVKDRRKDSHKYDHGHLLVVGGSNIYTGAVVLNSLAAYRTGVDLVSTVAPKRTADIAATYSPSIITYSVDGEYFEEKDVEDVGRILDKVDSIVLGCGIGRENETMSFVNKVLEQVDIPTVVDADALKALTENKDVIGNNFVLTPHLREFEGLIDEDVKNKFDEKKEKVENFSEEYGCTTVLKGEKDIISNGMNTKINETGSAYMTVGGTGDVLSGIIGSLMAQGINSFDAAMTGTWINGKAGEMASDKNGVGIMAEDIVSEISKVLRTV